MGDEDLFVELSFLKWSYGLNCCQNFAGFPVAREVWERARERQKKEGPIKVHTAHSKNRGSGINDEDFVAITLQREFPVSTDER